MIYLVTASAFVLSNFAYQAAGGHDWMLAVDRSFFQVYAIAGVALISKAAKWRRGEA